MSLSPKPRLVTALVNLPDAVPHSLTFRMFSLYEDETLPWRPRSSSSACRADCGGSSPHDAGAGRARSKGAYHSYVG